jgi:hypothetical protein
MLTRDRVEVEYLPLYPDLGLTVRAHPGAVKRP